MDAVHRLKRAQQADQNVLPFGHVNQELPFMYKDALISPEMYDVILDSPEYYHNPLAAPSPRLTSPIT